MNADRLVLPGVGAFKDGMEGLNQLGLIEPILQYASSGKPFLGICLGMQMMLQQSHEFGNHQGLGLIAGEVVSIPKLNHEHKKHKIPHIGWNALHSPAGKEAWTSTILEDIPQQSSMYFVHSFMAVPENMENNLAVTDYNGVQICAAIRKDNMFGCQFHPEKSGEPGLNIIKKFLEI